MNAPFRPDATPAFYITRREHSDMAWRTLAGDIATLVVAVLVVGSLANIALLTLSSSNVVGAGVTLALVVVAIAVTAVVGSKSREWLANPYW